MSSRSTSHDLHYDDDEIYDDSDDDYDDDHHSSEDEMNEQVNKEEEEKVNETVIALNIMTLSEKKKKQKQSSSSSLSLKKKNKKVENVQHVVDEMELNYYVPPSSVSNNEEEKKEEALSGIVNFSLNILQSSKMYFEDIEPVQLIQVSGNPAYLEQVRYLSNNLYQILRQQGKNYKTREDVMANELKQPQLIIQSVSTNKIQQQVQQLFNRVDHLSCLSSSGNSLFMYGGRKGNNQFDDLVYYEFSTGKVISFKSLQYATDQSISLRPITPPISNSAMFEYGGNVYIFGKSKKGNLIAYIYCDVFNHRNIRISQPVSIDVTHRNSFSFTLIEGALEYYLFGGKGNQVLSDMYKIRLTSIYSFEIIPISKNISSNWPSDRYAHSACSVSNNIFVYGGLNAKEQPMNDLFMFDTSSNVWTEIVTDSMVPPPLFKHQLFSVNNQSIYLHGGQLDNQPTFSNSLFRCDIIDKKWNMIEVLSDEQIRTFCGHQCHVVLGKVLMVGSVPDKQSQNKKQTKKTKELSPIVRLLNANDPGKSIQICSYLEGRRQEGYLCDVVFKVRDEESSTFTHVLAHKCIIKSRCESLHSKIEKSTERMSTHLLSGVFIEDDLTVVEISEASTEIFEQYLIYLYTGSIQSESVKELVDFTSIISPKKHYPLIQNICSITSMKSLELNKQVLSVIHQDFSTLMVDHSYSDLNIVLDQEGGEIENSQFEEDDKTLGIPVHRLIMSRSPFFSRMLVTSGMAESKEKTVHLSDYSKEVMLDLLKYLYTDIIKLTPLNCIGIMVYSMMFDMIDLASCCRRMVVSLLDKTNVWSVHEIALLYNEKSLESECERFIANNYSSLSFDSNFFNMPENSRMKIKQMHERKNKK